MPAKSREMIGVVGLGYVGLPVALAFAKEFATVGFDIDASKVEELSKGIDRNGEIETAELKNTKLRLSADPKALADCTFFVVAVPTPVDNENRPDLTPVIKASEIVGSNLRPGTVVVYESTVYPGLTEEIAGPILARVSGLKQGRDFMLGYSPERINPGDKQHTLASVTKIVAAEDAATLERVAQVYGAIVRKGLFRAASIKVAEAAKVIENTQRDLNIALMNELAIICDRLDIRTSDVLAAASTKWNFLPFSPGLVGGHCVGVDPYYLTCKAEQLGYQPTVILAGRRINNNMGAYIAQKVVKLLIKHGFGTKGARVGILGLTFKENITDLRNSRVIDIVSELGEFGIAPLVHDPQASAQEAKERYGIAITPLQEFHQLDALILAVPHRAYCEMPCDKLLASLRSGGVLIDVKSVIDPKDLGRGIHYWSL